MLPWHGYWHAWRCGWPGRWWRPPFGWPWAPIFKEQEIAILEEQSKILESELDGIKKRLEEIKT